MPWAISRPGRPVAAGPRQTRVVDFSAMWAGPLCAQLLGRCGAEVVKVEDVSRPDAARRVTRGCSRSSTPDTSRSCSTSGRRPADGPWASWWTRPMWSSRRHGPRPRPPRPGPGAVPRLASRADLDLHHRPRPVGDAVQLGGLRGRCRRRRGVGVRRRPDRPRLLRRRHRRPHQRAVWSDRSAGLHRQRRRASGRLLDDGGQCVRQPRHGLRGGPPDRPARRRVARRPGSIRRVEGPRRPTAPNR